MSWSVFALFRSRREDARPTPCDRDLGQPEEQQPLHVGTVDELSRRGRLVVRVPQSDVQIVVVRTRRGVFAFGDCCPHAGAPLCAADVAGTTVTCRRHARKYSLRSGRCVSALGSAARLRRWRAWLDDSNVWLGEEMT
ncbi:MAG TPA: Rieske 2Fe-2S domain-containing protein [Streptosporangiaceae bacterium]